MNELFNSAEPDFTYTNFFEPPRIRFYSKTTQIHSNMNYLIRPNPILPTQTFLDPPNPILPTQTFLDPPNPILPTQTFLK